MDSLDHIVIYGDGLAGALAASALNSHLSANTALTLIETEEAGKTDLAYGTATSPSSYEFFRHIGLSEPELLLGTSSAFSLGTHFKNWGPRASDWVQSFHLPLPLLKGVSFHHYVTRQYNSDEDNNDDAYSLAPYIMSVQAAKAGVFAHPPEGKNIPLAAVEYGYHVSPKALTEFLLSRLPAGRVTRITAAAADVNMNVSADNITSLTLASGDKITAGFFIDAAGPQSKMSAALGRDYSSGSSPRRVWMSETSEPQSKLGPPLRTLTQIQTGWQALTHLQGAVHTLQLSESKSDATSAMEVSFGRSAAPWRGNCLALGHSAAALEPLTPAPMMLLQRDIERLLELIPVSPDMSVGAREYNRRFKDDYVHAEIFHAAMTDGADRSNDGSKNDEHHHPKLENKITQFESRGTLVQYDLEPFSPHEWAMLHCGMGRRPARYDPLADQVAPAQAAKILTQIKSANSAMALKMPPHDVYMSGLLKYLKGKYAKL